MTGRMRIVRAFAGIALALAARPAHAQGVVDARMRDVLDSVRDDDGGDLAEFLPARGTLEWVLTTRTDDGARRGRWRLAAADLPRVMDPGMDSSCVPRLEDHDDGIVIGALRERVRDSEGRWRRVGATRFVPRGASAASPVFVEWRREDGRWVIAAVGDARDRREANLARWSGVDRMVPDSVPAGLLELPLPANAAYGPNTIWYQHNEPILVHGCPLVKYGYPRSVAAGSLRRIGTVQGVGVYVEAEARGRTELVFVAVTPDGLFQPYHNDR